MGSRPKKLVTPPPGPPGPTQAVKPVAAASLNPNAQKYLSFVAQLNTQFRSQMWKVFVDESADAILLLDQDLRCAFVNRTLEQMCGHASDEMLGLTLDELPVNFLTPEFTAGARRALVSGASSEFDIQCQQEAGSTQHRRIRLIPEVDTQARVLGVLCIAKDITEFKEAERKLGAKPNRIVACIGPCIAQRSYEVGPEFPAPFEEEDQRNRDYFAPARKPGHFLFDLAAYVTRRLGDSGVTVIQRCPNDTVAEEDRFFSYRRSCLRGESDYGRGLSAIVLQN